jgi:hypothetical protein
VKDEKRVFGVWRSLGALVRGKGTRRSLGALVRGKGARSVGALVRGKGARSVGAFVRGKGTLVLECAHFMRGGTLRF